MLTQTASADSLQTGVSEHIRVETKTLPVTVVPDPAKLCITNPLHREACRTSIKLRYSELYQYPVTGETQLMRLSLNPMFAKHLTQTVRQLVRARVDSQVVLGVANVLVDAVLL